MHCWQHALPLPLPQLSREEVTGTTPYLGLFQQCPEGWGGAVLTSVPGADVSDKLDTPRPHRGCVRGSA